MNYYRVLAIVRGEVDGFQAFSAIDDSVALVHARSCEPSKACELWREGLFVALLPAVIFKAGAFGAPTERLAEHLPRLI